MPPKIAALPGCKTVAVFGDDSEGEYGIFVLWESEADANAAAPVIRPQVDERIAGYAKVEPDARLFEVLAVIHDVPGQAGT